MPYPIHLLKGLDVHQIHNPFLGRQRARTLRIALPHQIIHQQAIQPLAAPLLVFDILKGVHALQLAQMACARIDMPVQTGLLVRAGGQLAF